MSAEVHGAPDVDPDEWIRDLEGKQVPFTVRDLATAEWAVRKIARARALHAEAQALYDVEKDRLDVFLAGAHHEMEHTEEFFAGQLRRWHESVLVDEPRRKTIRVPSGALKARKNPDRVEVADEDAFVCHVGLDSPLVVVRARPDLRALKAHIEATGEVLPGVELVAGQVQFRVDIS